MKLVSYVIPCYCSEQTVSGVISEIEKTMESLTQYDYEVILVNDCSPDNTYSVIEKLCMENARIKGVDFTRNFGQHAALMAGFQQSRGDLVVCLDDDGQTPADEVDKLLGELENGADAVYAKYEHKRHSIFRNMGSKLNELMAQYMLGKPKDLYVSSYFAVKRFVVDEMVRYENSYPYVIGLVLRSTKNISNVIVNHREREIGHSGYTMGKLMGLWFNGFTAFSVKPLRMATMAGCFCAALGFGYALYTIIKRLINPLVPAGFSSMMSAIMFIGGMLMIMLGLIGEYIGRIYISLNNAPQFVVREILNGDEQP